MDEREEMTAANPGLDLAELLVSEDSPLNAHVIGGDGQSAAYFGIELARAFEWARDHGWRLEAAGAG